MNRFLVLIIVVLFSLASISGPSMAVGVGSGAFWAIDNQELCLESASLVEKAPTFKPCSKKINGHAVSCQNMACILPPGADFISDQLAEVYATGARVVVPLSRTDRRFRPPRVS
ncbi:hypothetical protein [Devosia submarina]|uniref:hypothetical protein n=1 Tax=Devosia submarina TaxID=1173082 RepID=UPI000D34E49A|nr:hypothetical protein [Devosia submarina]